MTIYKKISIRYVPKDMNCNPSTPLSICTITREFDEVLYKFYLLGGYCYSPFGWWYYGCAVRGGKLDFVVFCNNLHASKPITHEQKSR